jgi:hypothetical protein
MVVSNPAEDMDVGGYSSVVFTVCCISSGLFDELITCSEESGGVCVCVCVCVCQMVCDLDTSTMRRPERDLGCSATKNEHLPAI